MLSSPLNMEVIGVSHRTADLSTRSALAINPEEIGRLLVSLQEGNQGEAFILSTCNRTEVYFLHIDSMQVEALLCNHSGFTAEQLFLVSYHKTGWDAVRHLFTVASGLDSAAVGESEILGQLKVAFKIAQDCGSAGRVLHPLMQRTLRASKRVRTESGLGRRGLSLASIAVRRASSLAHGIKSKRVLIVGAGQIAESVVKNLRHQGAEEVTICNRNLERAVALAAINNPPPIPPRNPSLAEALVATAQGQSLQSNASPGPSVLEAETPNQAQPPTSPNPPTLDSQITSAPRPTGGTYNAIPLTDLDDALSTSDIVFLAVSIDRPLIGEHQLTNSIRPGTVLIDLGVPSNVAPFAKGQPGLKVVDIDELQAGVQRNADQIAELTPLALALVEEEVKLHTQECAEREAAPFIEALVSRSEQVRRTNLEWALSQIPEENIRERKLMEDLSIRLTRGMIGEPIQTLKTGLQDPSERAVIAKLFQAEV